MQVGPLPGHVWYVHITHSCRLVHHETVCLCNTLLQVETSPIRVPVGSCYTLTITGRCGTRPSACGTGSSTRSGGIPTSQSVASITRIGGNRPIRHLSAVCHNAMGRVWQVGTDDRWKYMGNYYEKMYPPKILKPVSLLYDCNAMCNIQDSKFHGANMGPTWVLSAQDGPHVGPMNLAIRDGSCGTMIRRMSARSSQMSLFIFVRNHREVTYAMCFTRICTRVLLYSCFVVVLFWVLDWCHLDGLVQENHYSLANALELRLSCTNPLIYWLKILSITSLAWLIGSSEIMQDMCNMTHYWTITKHKKAQTTCCTILYNQYLSNS